MASKKAAAPAATPSLVRQAHHERVPRILSVSKDSSRPKAGTRTRQPRWGAGWGPAASAKKKTHTAHRLSHVDPRGRVKMVDVGDKPVTTREAVARGTITMSREALRLIRRGAVQKGDPLQTARLAGILAAKQTSALIPLCHPLPLSSVNVELTPTARGYQIEARVRTDARTGVEMEALTAVAVAGLTIYDMVKAVDRSMVIGEIRLMFKSGGRSGTYIRR